MRYLIYGSILLLMVTGCARKLHSPLYTGAETMSKQQILPQFNKALYRCVVDGKLMTKKFHLSGILYLRNFSDTATRVVFQGEMGNTFFDFGWDSHDSFQVHSIIEQMDRTALIKTLKKDFELLLLKNIPEKGGVQHTDSGKLVSFTLLSDSLAFAGYHLDSMNRLKHIRNGNSKKTIVDIMLTPPSGQNLPEHILIDHKRAHFTIDMNRIQSDEE